MRLNINVQSLHEIEEAMVDLYRYLNPAHPFQCEEHEQELLQMTKAALHRIKASAMALQTDVRVKEKK